MTKLLWLLAILMCGTLFLVGCGGGSDEDDAGVAPAVVTNTPPPVVTNAPPDPNAEFAAITPAGLQLADKFTIVGRGTVYSLRCNAIAGAANYTFTTSFGASQTVAVPTVSLLYAGADDEFTFSVYATNTNGFNTRTASASVN
jgi:hypothetical protein